MNKTFLKALLSAFSVLSLSGCSQAQNQSTAASNTETASPKIIKKARKDLHPRQQLGKRFCMIRIK